MRLSRHASPPGKREGLAEEPGVAIYRCNESSTWPNAVRLAVLAES